MLAAVLFDLDGTLTNTDSLHFQAWRELLRLHGLEIDEDFYKACMSGRLNPAIVRDLLPELSTEAGLQLIETKEANFRAMADQLQPLPGLVDVLAWIREQGLKQGVVTNAPRENAWFMLKALHLETAFDPVVIGDDIGIGKPDPTPYRLALQKLGIPPEAALVFEDSPSGVRAAVGAGIPTVGIASTQDPQDLYDLGAMLVIPDFTDSQLWALLSSDLRAEKSQAIAR